VPGNFSMRQPEFPCGNCPAGQFSDMHFLTNGLKSNASGIRIIGVGQMTSAKGAES
jgi:hypothetical protein